MIRRVPVVALLLTASCVATSKPSSTMPELIGQSRATLIETLGEPTRTEYLPQGVMCEKTGFRLTLDYSKPSYERCMFFEMRSAFQNIPAGIPVELLTFQSGQVREYSVPTTATTTFSGNRAYTTIYEGGSYARDSRCTVIVAIIRGRVNSYDLSGEGC